MASLNRVTLIGRLTDNPEPPRTLPNSGSTVVKFRFAVGRNRKNPQTGQWENDPNPLYIDCEVFTRQDTRRDLCNLVTQYTRKGSQLYIEGRLQLDTWEDKNGGGKRSKHKVVVENLEFLDKADDSRGAGGSSYSGGGMEDDMGGPPPARSNYGGGSRGGPPARNAPPPQRGGYSAGDDDMDGPPGGGGNGDDIPF